MYLIQLLILAFFPAPQSPGVSVLHLQSPNYPRLARIARIEGAAKLMVTIGESGKVISVKGVSGNPILQSAAEENIREWTFNPGPQRTLEISYDFGLTDPAVDFGCEPEAQVIFDLPERVVIRSRLSRPSH